MKKLNTLLLPLMVMPLFTCCASKGEVSLTTRFKYCVVDGLKDNYQYGEKVSLKLKPYPYFSLPNKEDIIIGGVNDFTYDQSKGDLSFAITNKTALVIEAASDFNGQEQGYLGISQWFKDHKGTAPNKISVHYKYAFTDIEEGSEEETYAIEMINHAVYGDIEETKLTELTGDYTFTDDELTDIKVEIGGKSFARYDETDYIFNYYSQPTDKDQAVAFSTNIKTTKECEEGVSGYAHWFGKTGACDSLHLKMNNMLLKIDDPSGYRYLKPINGFMDIDVIYDLD